MAKATTSRTSKKTTTAARQVVAGKTTVASGSIAAAAVSEALIAERAYLIYLEEGCPDGRHLEHWRRAETELRG